jgi:HAD superfamily hydrolase (TIGR01509 family)
MQNTILLFDLGGVLVDLGDPVTEIGLDIDSDDFWATWLSSPLVQAYETGRLSSQEFVTQFGAHLGFSDIAEFDRRIRNWRLPLFDGSEQFLTSLAGQVEIALLSNTNEIHWQYVQSQTDVFAMFSKLFLSFETGKTKPELAAFQDVIEHFDCDPADIIFLDDNANNIAAAQDAGLRSRQTKGLQEVKKAVNDFLA